MFWRVYKTPVSYKTWGSFNRQHLSDCDLLTDCLVGDKVTSGHSTPDLTGHFSN